jgi:AbrB family looped-hinge helix DNA binding protein
MGHMTVLMDRSGRLVVPKELRTSLGLENGGELLLSIEDGALVAMTRQEVIRRVQSMFRPWQPGEPLASEELIAERRREARRDLE